MQYLLDSNIFIEAYHRYYNDKIVSSFWQWLENDEDIYTISQVKEEIKAGTDDLYKLIQNVRELNTVSELMRDIATYVQDKYDNPAETDAFLAKADPLLISTASAAGATIVSNEVLVGDDSTKIKIPNVCNEFEVEYNYGIFDILRSKQINLSQPGV